MRLGVSNDVFVDGFIPAQANARARQNQLRRQLASADIIAGAIAGAVIAVVAGLELDALPVVGLALAVGWPAVAYVCGLHAPGDLQSWASGAGDAPRLATASLLISWPVYALLSSFDAAYPAVGAITAAAVTGAAAGMSRAAVRIALHRSESLRQRTLILGSGVVARQLVERISRHPQLGLDAVGYIDDDVHEGARLGVPRLGTLRSLEGLLAAGGVDRVMIAFTRSDHQELLHAIRVCRDAGVTVDIVPRLFEFLDGARRIEQIGGIPLLTIEQAALSPLAHACKRALDIVGALAAIFILSPVFLLVAIAIRLDSPGPVLFTQQRAGRGGRFFKLYKFRSMKIDSGVLVREDGAIVKRRHDDRVTRVGRLIRRFSIDEAPQFLNVLRGDMSLVGPRPLVLAEYAALSESWQSRRADLRPGLTGPWQISGRSNIPFEDMIKFDYQYVVGWSLARDIEILLATLPAVVSGRGAF